MVVELVGRNVEPRGELVRGDRAGGAIATAVEEVGEQRLEDTEALGRNRPRRSLRLGTGLLGNCGPRRLRRLTLVHFDDALEPALDLFDESRRCEWACPSFLAEDPAGQRVQAGVRRFEDIPLDLAELDHPVRPPSGVRIELDFGLPDDLAELPVLAAAILRRLEVCRRPKVSLPSRGEADVPANT